MKIFRSSLLVALASMMFNLGAAEVESLVPLCEGCHGMAGVSGHDDIPTISGQSEEYIADNLRAFQVWGRPCIKSDFRYGDTSRPKIDMCQVAEGMSEADILAMARHFSTLPFVPADQDFDPDLAANGAKIHAERCENCHHEGGSVPATGPRIAGQWVGYLEKALKFVPTGEHLVPRAMENTVAELTPSEVDALMNYYASQQD